MDLQKGLGGYAHVGDSRILVGGSGRPVQLTRDHRPSVGYERQRITMAGGYISRGRVNGILEMTRSLGDIELKPIVSAEPDTASLNLHHLTPDFLVLASDGLFELLSNERIVYFVYEGLDRQDSVHKIARDLVNWALDVGSSDNVSVVLVLLHKPKN